MILKLSNHRLLAIFVMGILVGLYRYHDYVTWNQRGKDAFITNQLQRFDRYMAHPHSLLFTLVSTAFAYALILGIYELIAGLIEKIMPLPASSPVPSPNADIRA
jgi:hypothetical protein